MWRHVTIALALLGIVGGGYLHAQPASGDDKDAVTTPGGTTAKLSPREMTEKADADISTMKDVLRRVIELQLAARKQKDIIKLNCVNDKLLQVKQLLNIAESSRNNLIEAIASRDEGERYHQFGQITIAFEKTSGLRDEAEGCIGDELTFVGPTEVEVDKPPIIDNPADDDPFYFGGEPIIERPNYASPFR